MISMGSDSCCLKIFLYLIPSLILCIYNLLFYCWIGEPKRIIIAPAVMWFLNFFKKKRNLIKSVVLCDKTTLWIDNNYFLKINKH